VVARSSARRSVLALTAVVALGAALATSASCKRRAPSGLPAAPPTEAASPTTAGAAGTPPTTGAGTASAANSGRPPAGPPVACLADRLPTLVLDIPDSPQCTANPRVCRDLCITGDAAACIIRASSLESSATRTEATVLYAQACAAGAASGCTNYAAHTWTDGTPDDMPCAKRIMAAACKARDPYACGMTVRFELEDPNATANDRVSIGERAKTYCNEAQGFACVVLARFIEEGVLETPNATRVQALLAQACSSGYPDACGKTSAKAILK